MASWKSRWEGGGQKGLEIQVGGGGYKLEYSSSGVIFDRCIKDCVLLLKKLGMVLL